MKKVLLSVAAGLILVAAGASTAEAQRGKGGGPGFSRGGSPGGVAFRGAGFRGGPAFVGGPRRFAGGPAFVGRRAFVGGPAFVGRRAFIGGPGFYGPRRFVRRGSVWVGGYPFYGYRTVGGCHRWRVVPTVYGPQWRWVNVCYPIYRAYPYRVRYVW